MSTENKSSDPKGCSTLEDLLVWGAEQFESADLHYGHGTDNPWDEVVAIARFVLNLPIDAPHSEAKKVLLEEQKHEIISLIQKRILDRRPAPYITGEAWFAGLPFFVDDRVLIPRSPLAELIEKHFSPWLDQNQQPKRILDLCTGSGCIAVALAQAYPEAYVDAVDIDQHALDVAAINIKQHALNDRITCIQSDLFHALKDNTYDLIVSNPPYVSTETLLDLPKEYMHEPELALAGGKDGLILVDNILSHAKDHLTENGLLVVEVGESAQRLTYKYPLLPFVWPDFERGGEGVFLLRTQDLLGV